ncbi:helix-turn-helix domain-containing protein [Deinococcus sp. HMF7620]|uniref:Helix-turn-helix domain-containing protein n=1 Tax=Deinococcus arboris TaxID=2682977 RepID=A0A7C9HTG3_9DEIO|nr:helix-turn-helix transcriptional regulator [Deinococcus arboris]MVN88512.1 helix-turn-helix domain-containing protein [Deinococcus arboris]
MGQPLSPDALDRHQQHLGARIRALRTARGWSQDTLAHQAGLNRSYPHKIEVGLIDLRYSTLLRLAAAFELSPAELLTFPPDEQAHSSTNVLD